MDDVMVWLIMGVVLAGAGWTAFSRIDMLQRRIVALERKIEVLLTRQADGSAPSLAPPPSPAVRSGLDASRPTAMPAAQPVATARPAQTVKPPLKSGPKPLSKPANKPAPKSPSKPAPVPKPTLDLETLLGAKGSVWIGGIALLFGAVFLLRYTIEAGLLTPMMRISVAVLMGVIALGLSEWMARRDLKSPAAQALAAKADIPAILAAVGVFTLFGAVYAAHALYGLIGTLVAFIGLALIALGGMGLSLRRGPWLAAIGLIGALVVPLLVASVTPSYFGVVAYVALITGAALWVARHQAWPWLRAAALIGATFWQTMLLGDAWKVSQFSLWALSVVGVSILTLSDIIRGSDGPHRRQWLWLGWGGIAVLTALVMLGGDSVWWIAYALPYAYLLGLITTAIRVDADRFWLLLPLGGVLFTTLFVSERLRYIATFEWPLLLALLALAAIFALAILSVANRLTSGRGAMGFTLVGGVIAVVMLGVSDLDLWTQFAMAGLFSVATVRQKRLSVVCGAIWAAGLLWLIPTFILFTSTSSDLPTVSVLLSVGLAGMIGLVLLSKPGRDDTSVRLAPMLLAGAAGLAALVALEDSATYVFTTPVLNALWLYFGLPGAIAALGAFLLQRRREDFASQALLGGAIVFALLLTVLLIHHAMNGGNLRATPGFADYAVQLLVAFAVLFGASWLRGGLTDWPDAGAEPRRFIVPVLALLVSGLSLLLFITAQLFALNPLLNALTVINGHPVFNSLLLGYLAPAVLLGGAALRFSGRRPVWFVRLLGALAGVSWLVWTTAQIRRLAQGDVIAIPSVSWGSGELYAVSAVWLLTGIALLGAGMKTGRRDLRLASAGLITLTTLKVFLVDMAALDGALRAVSFIGLGIVLIGIGRLYQTILTRPDGVATIAEGEDGSV